MFVLVFVLFTSLLLFYNFFWKRRLLPPGPVPLPIIGNLHTLARLAPGYAAFEQWSKKYGPVFTFWASEDPIIAVTDYELIKNAFVKDGDAYAGRDFMDNLFECMESTKGNYGVIRSQGEEWTQLRRFALKLMRNLGMGRNVMEQRIMVEVEDIIKKLNDEVVGNKMSKEGYHLSSLIDLAVGSVINQLAFGFRFDGDNLKNFFELREAINENFEDFLHPLTYIISAMPWVRHMPFFSAHLKGIEKSSSKLHNFYDKNIRETMERVKNEAKSGIVDDEEDTYFIKAFIQEMEQQKHTPKADEKEKSFTIANLRGLCEDLFVGGMDTTSNTMNFLILYMVVFPEVQAKMQEELDQVMGDNEDGKKLICLAEKAKLPYTNAVINESQRLVNLVPITLIHRTTKDVVIGGYAVKKGARIVPQVSSVLYDEKIFPKPHEFIPERFIEDGQLKKCEELIPFSLGKRQCLGESMARMELFLFTANLFYLYKMSAVNPLKPPSLEKVTGLTVSPIKYNCIIEKRKQHLSN